MAAAGGSEFDAVFRRLRAILEPFGRRMQGKSCFNFTAVDESLFAELVELTGRGYDRTAGNPGWGAARREEHGMAHRKAMAGTPSR